MSIFISYRRGATAAAVGHIKERLERHFDDVFQDVSSIAPGADYRAHTLKMLGRATVVLAMIGPDWRRDGSLFSPTDWIRIELEPALERPDVTVIPVLVEGAELPKPEELPPSLRPLLERQALRVSAGPDFDYHVSKLITAVEPYTKPRDVRSRRRRSAIFGLIAGALVIAGAAAAWKARPEPPPVQPPPVQPPPVQPPPVQPPPPGRTETSTPPARSRCVPGAECDRGAPSCGKGTIICRAGKPECEPKTCAAGTSCCGEQCVELGSVCAPDGASRLQSHCQQGTWICRRGQRACEPPRTLPERCDNAFDEDCDGRINEENCAVHTVAHETLHLGKGSNCGTFAYGGRCPPGHKQHVCEVIAGPQNGTPGQCTRGTCASAAWASGDIHDCVCRVTCSKDYFANNSWEISVQSMAEDQPAP